MSELTAQRGNFQFSMRTLFMAIFAIAILTVAVRLMPLPITLLVAGSIPAPVLLALAIRRRQLRRPLMISALLVGWILFYAVSIGPVATLAMWQGLERNRQFLAHFYNFYAPVLFLHKRTRLAGPIESYMDFWQDAGLRLREM